MSRGVGLCLEGTARRLIEGAAELERLAEQGFVRKENLLRGGKSTDEEESG